MVVVPRWARAKVLRAKRNRRSSLAAKVKIQHPLMQTMSYEDQYGNVVAYRDHARSGSGINENALLDGESVLVLQYKQVTTEHKWHGYPTEFVAFLSCFDKVPDDQLPPLVAVTRKRKKEWQSAIQGQGKTSTVCMTVSVGSFRHIFCFLNAKTAFFVWLSKDRGQAKRSADVPASFAQFLVSEVQRNPLYKIEKVLTWIETVDYKSTT